MIAIVDYGIGNLVSVTKGFRHVGAEVQLTGDHDALRRASAPPGTHPDRRRTSRPPK